MTDFTSSGFILLKNLFNNGEVKRVFHDIERVFRNYTNDTSAGLDELIFKLYQEDNEGFLGCANACHYLPSLWEIATGVSKHVAKVGIKFPVINTRPLLSFSSSKLAKDDTYWRVPPHQDWPSMQGSINAVTCWCPLRDVEDSMGPLEVSKGSHMNGPLEHIDKTVPMLDKSEHEFEGIPMNAGDALFFSTFLVHRSGVNVSDKIRYSMHFRFDDLEESTFIERKYPRHRIERRKEGILYPNFPKKEQVHALFNDNK